MNILVLMMKEYWPIVAAFLLGIVLGTRGCGDVSPEVITIDKPVPQIEYVDRWKTDTVRHVSKEVSVRFDTITLDRIERVLDTLLVVDTLKIVETWLTEQLNYDTLARFKESSVRVSWSNYQNQSENLKIQLSAPRDRMRIGGYARAGIETDFNGLSIPVIGGGLLLNRRRFIFGTDYAYNLNHQITLLFGYQL